MRKIRVLKKTIIFGFDSAWTDNTDNPGAICAVAYDANGQSEFYEPRLASFSQAEDFIAEKDNKKEKNKEKSYELSVISLDQSLIVTNATGMRPVEKIAGSAVGWAGGGVQPSNRSRRKMFDDNARIWKFLSNQAADLNAYSARESISGNFIIEVFPALALLGLSEKFYIRKGAPKYNPKKNNFNIEHWKSVCTLLEEKSSTLELNELSAWASKKKNEPEPKKEDQDMLDSAICALIGVIWIACEASCSMMIGNMKTGYMITPVIEDMRIRLEEASRRHGML